MGVFPLLEKVKPGCEARRSVSLARQSVERRGIHRVLEGIERGSADGVEGCITSKKTLEPQGIL